MLRLSILAGRMMVPREMLGIAAHPRAALKPLILRLGIAKPLRRTKMPTRSAGARCITSALIPAHHQRSASGTSGFSRRVPQFPFKSKLPFGPTRHRHQDPTRRQGLVQPLRCALAPPPACPRENASVIRSQPSSAEYVASGTVTELLKIFFCVRRERVRKICHTLANLHSQPKKSADVESNRYPFHIPVVLALRLVRSGRRHYSCPEAKKSESPGSKR